MATSRNLGLLILVLSLIDGLVFLPNLQAEDANPLRSQFKEIRQTSLGKNRVREQLLLILENIVL